MVDPKESRRPRSAPALTPEDAEFAAATAAASRSIQVSQGWGETLETEVEALAQLQIQLEDVRDPLKGPSTDREIMAAAQAFRSQEARVNQILQRRLAAEIKRLRT